LIEKFETEEPLSNCGSLRRIESGPFSSLNFPNRLGGKIDVGDGFEDSLCW